MAKNPSLLKVAMVLDDGLDNPDGVQQYILDLGKWLRSQGHSVDYLVGETKRKDIKNLYSLSKNISIDSNGNSMTIPLPSSNRNVKQHMREHSYDIIHVQTPYSPFMGAKCIRFAKDTTAVIGTFHIMPNSRIITLGNRLLGVWLYKSLKRFDKMLSVSSAARDFAKRSFRIDSDIVPNVVDYQEFSTAKKIPKYDDNVVNILFLGRLVPRKGCSTLLEAVKILSNKQELPKFRLIICGKGQLDHELKNYCQQNGLDQLVYFEGFVPETIKPSYYESADIAAFPSTSGESFGIVLLEAMAARTAVLAANNPGYASVMSPFPESIFEPNNAIELAKKLAALITDSSERKRLAVAQSDYAKHFDINKVGSDILNIYNDALIKRRNR